MQRSNPFAALAEPDDDLLAGHPLIPVEGCACQAMTAIADAAAGRICTLALPAGYDLLSANDRHHYWTKAKIVAQIRKDVAVLARAQHFPKLTAVRITAVLHPRDKRHQDSDNVQPTVKAAVDELVAQGYLPGDDERYVLSTTYMLGAPVKGKQLVLHFAPAGGVS